MEASKYNPRIQLWEWMYWCSITKGCCDCTKLYKICWGFLTVATIALFLEPRLSYKGLPKLRRGHPLRGALNRGGVRKCRNLRPTLGTDISHNTHKWLKVDVYKQRGGLHALNLLSVRVTLTAIVPRAYPREAKMCQNGKILNLRVNLLGNDARYKCTFCEAFYKHWILFSSM